VLGKKCSIIKLNYLVYKEIYSGKSLNEIQPAISTAKRFCRFGAGHEEHVGVGDTPGFECEPNPSITPDGHVFITHLVFQSQGIP
jgi:hypothetical protein